MHGFGSLSEQMKELLGLWKNADRQSAEVKQLTLKHIETLKQKITQLQEMANWLQSSADHCSGDEQADCVILKDIELGKWFGIKSSTNDLTVIHLLETIVVSVSLNLT